MRRYLVVAHQTVTSPELLAAMRKCADEGECTFYLVVPEYHGGSGFTYTEGKARAEARRRLEEALAHFEREGLSVTGEVGDANPVDAVTEVLRREGKGSFEAVIVSTLPPKFSKWLRLDAPTRIRRTLGLPVIHVVGHPVPA